MARTSESSKIADARLLLENNGYMITAPNYFREVPTNKELSVKALNFYQTNNPMYAGCIAHTDDGDINVLPFSKKWIESTYKELCIKSKNNKKIAMYKLTRMLQIPWIEAVWMMADESKSANFKIYIGKLNSLHQYSDLTIEDSEPYIGENTDIEDDFEIKRKKLSKPKKEELLIKWGNYDTDVLYRFEEKYEFLKNNYKEQTNMHTEALFRYIRYAVLEQIANESGDTGGAKTYNDLANKAATAAKINPSQLSKADLTDGLNSFSELSLAVEKAVDIVRILPKFKFRPNDALDFTIWCYINYERNLNGLPEVEYEDVYKFYDKKVAEFIEQYGDPYGMFSEDTTKFNRDSVKNFIKPFKEEVE